MWYKQLLMAGLLLGAVLGAPAVNAQANPEPSFWQVWQAYDAPVAGGIAARSWTWGPAQLTDVRLEPMEEAFGGQQLVQYFDKGSMELNERIADPTDRWRVVGGLLPLEMMTGRIKTGYNRAEQHSPARITMIGDPGQFPTYADVQPLYADSGPETALPGADQWATRMLQPDGSSTTYTHARNDPAAGLTGFDNGYFLPDVFVAFIHQRGIVARQEAPRDEQLYLPMHMFGRPITPAVWVQVQVGGVERPILFQVFERRVLTYNPANQPAYQVEMGNVGKHYVEWQSIPVLNPGE